MSISLSCSSCHRKLTAPDKAAGKKVKCPQCGSPIVIPSRARSAASPHSKNVGSKPSVLNSADAEDAAAGLLLEGGSPSARLPSPPDLEETENAARNGPDRKESTSEPAQAAPVATARPETKRCPSCSTPLPPNAVFCATCGVDVNTGAKRLQPKRSQSKAVIWGVCGLAGLLLVAGIVGVGYLSGTRSEKQQPQLPEQNTAAPADEAEVAKSWQHFIAQVKSPERLNRPRQQWEHKFPDGTFAVVFRADDVKKSDSLKSPYIGTVRLDAAYVTGNAGFVDSCELHFGYKDGRWKGLDVEGERTPFALVGGQKFVEKKTPLSEHNLSDYPYLGMLFAE
jgi:DNA-directed RNA polymerase subunit RPC12/RpoP